jgi:putative membrane protein
MIKGYVFAAGLLHFTFMFLELIPWKLPFAIQWTTGDLPSFTPDQQHFVRGIVQNAGIYNGIVAGGLIYAAYAGTPAADVARVLLIGAAVAGVFGALTLKKPYLPALQALVGAIGAILV